MSDAAAPRGARRWARLRRSPWRAVLAALLFAGAGVAYALTVGCSTGTCPITRSPLNAGLYGALVGVVVGWPERKRRE